MLKRGSLGAFVLSAVLLLPFGAQAHDESKYPNWEASGTAMPALRATIRASRHAAASSRR